MEFAIIAAGEGSRLAKEGFNQPKPMVRLQGRPLISRLIDVFVQNKATAIHIIINEYSPLLETYLQNLNTPVPLNIIKKNTPSSLHSFYEIVSCIKGNEVCLTTVDTVFNEQEFEAYIHSFVNHPEYNALMAATSFIDDEKPLYIATDGNDRITQYLDDNTQHCELVSGGIYCLRRSVFPMVSQVVAAGVDRMRNFQRLLVTKGFMVQAYRFSKIVDIDHVADIASAEAWLNESAQVTA